MFGNRNGNNAGGSRAGVCALGWCNSNNAPGNSNGNNFGSRILHKAVRLLARFRQYLSLPNPIVATTQSGETRGRICPKTDLVDVEWLIERLADWLIRPIVILRPNTFEVCDAWVGKVAVAKLWRAKGGLL